MRQLGWSFTAATLLFCALFLGRAEIRSPHYDAVAEGTVLAIERTSSSENEQDIFAVDVEYRPATGDGATRTIRSYTVTPPAVGARVTVDYQAASPDEACLRGGRTAPFGKWVALLLLMPVMGLIFCFVGVRADLRYLRVLRDGRQTTATFVSAHKQVSEDGETATEVRLRFTDELGREHFLHHHTFKPERLRDDLREIIFYDGEDPARAVALDYLPGRLELRGDTFVARQQVWPLFIAPLLALGSAVALGGALLLS